jgi:hypothetical protein
MLRDLRHAFRTLARAPGYTATVISPGQCFELSTPRPLTGARGGRCSAPGS